MNATQIVGAVLLAIFAAVIIGFTRWATESWKVTAAIWGSSLALTAVMFVGLKLLAGDLP